MSGRKEIPCKEKDCEANVHYVPRIIHGTFKRSKTLTETATPETFKSKPHSVRLKCENGHTHYYWIE